MVRLLFITFYDGNMRRSVGLGCKSGTVVLESHVGVIIVDFRFHGGPCCRVDQIIEEFLSSRSKYSKVF